MLQSHKKAPVPELIKLHICRRITLSNRDSDTSVFVLVLRDFSKQLLYGTSIYSRMVLKN